jgi:hypothetical protein
VTLFKSGNDTLVTIPLEQIDNINKQLKESRKNKSDYAKIYKAWSAQKVINDTLKLKLILCDSLINIKDSIIVVMDNAISKNHSEYTKAVNRYERAEKKNKKYKSTSLIVGSLLILINLVVLVLK